MLSKGVAPLCIALFGNVTSKWQVGMICRVGFPLTFSNVYFPASCATQHNRGMQKETLECCGGVGTWMVILPRKQISQYAQY